MKKFVSILLALAMILALSIPVSAAENTSLTINNSNGRTYNGYQLLKLTTSLNCEENHDHEDDCYNYAYTVNKKYETILQAQAGTDADIIAYLNGLTSDSDSGYGSLRAVADSIYTEILKDNIEPDAAGLDGSDTIDQGYWLFADVSNLTGNASNSLVMVDTKGQDALTITPKTALPTVVKKVMDTNDTTGATTDWQDSADYDIGDEVPFQLTATLPDNLAFYNKYTISFHDTLSAGLTLDVSSIEVTANGVDVTDKFDLPANAASEFEIACEDILLIDGVNAGTVFVVTYTATLNDDAVIGEAGNPNEVYLEFSNDPYSTEGSTGKTETDKVTVFTYQLTINKVDADQAPLKGAAFTLYKKNANGTYEPIGSPKAGTGENENVFQWKGLDDGDYKLVESTVPDGYNKMTDVEFTISAEHEAESADPKLTSLTSSLGTATDGVIEKNIENKTGTVLPETGAKGTMILITVSTLFIMVAAVFMITRKKMSVYED